METKFLGKTLHYITTCEKACTGPCKITFVENGSVNAYMNAKLIGNEHVWLNHWMGLQEIRTYIRIEMNYATDFHCSI
jgi:hypothetical protein